MVVQRNVIEYINSKPAFLSVLSSLTFQSPAAPPAADSKGDYSDKEPTVPNHDTQPQSSKTPPAAASSPSTDFKVDGGESKEQFLSFSSHGNPVQFCRRVLRWSFKVELFYPMPVAVMYLLPSRTSSHVFVPDR